MLPSPHPSTAHYQHKQVSWMWSSVSQEERVPQYPHGLTSFPDTRRRLHLHSSATFYTNYRNPNSIYRSVFVNDKLREEGRGLHIIVRAENNPSNRKPRSSGRRGKHLNIGRLPGNTVRKPKGPQPYVRHPEEHYKYGPYGPYSYKAPVIGTLKPVTTLTTHYVNLWSNVRDLKEQERIDIHNACVSYENRVRTFDESVGLQFFYVFVRLPFKAIDEPPWKDWSLVSEITLESGESLDKLALHFRLSRSVKNMITQHVGWFRPDLVFVKKPGYQIRFEPEMEFLREQKKLLLSSVGETHEEDSYYGRFCKLLGVNLDAGHVEVTSKFEKSSEAIQLACLEHLFMKHPVELFYRYPYPNREVWMKGKLPNSKGNVVEVETFRPQEEYVKEELNEESYAEGYSESDEEMDDEAGAKTCSDIDDELLNSDIAQGGAMDKSDFEESSEYSDDHEEDQLSDDMENVPGDEMDTKRYVKAAIRPYTYVNLIEEMVILRHSLLERKRLSVA